MSALTSLLKALPLLGLGAGTALVVTQVDFSTAPNGMETSDTTYEIAPLGTSETSLDEDLQQAARISQNLECQSLMLQQVPLPPDCITLIEVGDEGPALEQMLTEAMQGADE
jgi:hypothetical protein